MTERKLFGVLTGWQLTILGSVAILAPGVVYAAVNFQAVAIVDPGSGTKSKIDAGRRLHVFDPVANQENNPANFVNVQFIHNGTANTAKCLLVYTVPSGRALVITGVSGSVEKLSGSNSSSFYIDSSDTCPSPDLVGYSVAAQTYTLIESNLQPGVAVPSGSKVSTYTFNANAYGFIRGYLVPASWVPAPGSVAALQTQGSQKAEKR